jgi:hypothetical protein
MALLTNINGKFSVDTDGAASFNRIGASTTTGFTFPSADGANGEVLKTNGLGTVSWLPDSNTGTVTGTGSATRVAFWSSDSAITSDADLYWDNTNKRLGIGVSSPAALLEINGTGDAIRVESTNTGAGGAQMDLLHYSTSPADNDTMAYINMGGYYNTTPSQAYFSSIRTVATDISARQGELTFWTVNTTLQQRMVIDTDGNVGIGTSSPSSYDGEADNLVVYDAITPGITIALPQTTAAGSARGSILFADGTSGNEKYRGGVIYDHGTGMGGVADTMYIRSAVNNYMVLGPTGNVGIGTKTPIEKLQVAGQIISTASNSTSATAGAERAIMDLSGFTATDHSARFGHFRGATAAGAGQMRLYTDSVERVRIDASGNVGIGTDSPMTKLHIQSGNGSYPDDANNHLVVESSSHSYIGLGGGTSSDVGIHFGDSGGIAQGRIAYKNSDNSMRFMANSSERLTILASGSVGIGSTDPYSRLDVNGVITNRTASQDPNFTVAVVGGVSTLDGGSLQFTQGFGGTSAAGDTVVFRYNAASWKSWSLDYTFAFYNGLIKGTIGGYSNNSMDSTNAFLSNTANATVVATNSGQNVIVTFTGNFGIHMMCDMRYSQGGGDGSPRADRASLTFNS